MSVLSALEPKSVFRFFEEICAIPHGSHNTKMISDYLVSFAKARGLKYRQDDLHNVIIWKEASPGYENAPAVMLQGHIDMVAEKEVGCAKDMEKEGLDLFIDGDVIGARQTTLGGDDGIAVAMAMAILDAKDICHPPLECVFTVDEEVGMLGAKELDTSALRAQYCLNLDSEEEKVLIVSSAGSIREVCTLPIEREAYEGTVFELKISGLEGGHSGEEIHKGRANANILLGRALYELKKTSEMRLITVRGGAKDNVIPSAAAALVTLKDAESAKKTAKKLQNVLKDEYRAVDGGICLSMKMAESSLVPMDEGSTRRIISYLFCAPNGVQVMSADVPGLVQTSLNLGWVSTEDKAVKAGFMVRSSVDSQAAETADKVMALTASFGGETEIVAASYAWQYRPQSKLREVMGEAFAVVYGEEPTITALHAGLECGILLGKMPQLDCISYGPTITDIHSPRERLHIASTERTWKLTIETLKRLK